LATAAGNALEVRNAIDYLTGERRDARLHEVVMALGAEALVLARQATTTAGARAKLARRLDDGTAAERFQRMVAGLGGPKDLISKPNKHLQTAPFAKAIAAEESGTVTVIDTRALGLAVIELGGGRRRVEDRIDHSVGLTRLAGLGSWVEGTRAPLALVHARTPERAERAAAIVREAYRVGVKRLRKRPIVIDRVVGPDR
jgi:thymidine phosphorylase